MKVVLSPVGSHNKLRSWWIDKKKILLFFIVEQLSDKLYSSAMSFTLSSNSKHIIHFIEVLIKN